MKNKFIKASLIITAILLQHTFVYASQEKIVADRETVNITVSSKDPNIISLGGDRIKQFSIVKGVATASIDDITGIMNIKPVGAYNTIPFSTILFSEKGKRYVLVLVPKNVPAQDIVLNNPESSVNSPNIIVPNTYYYNIGSLIKSMIKGVPLENNKITYPDNKQFDENALQQMNHQSDVTRLTISARYASSEFIGEIIEIQNAGSNLITLNEEDFLGDNVLAISLSSRNLEPNAIANIYRVIKHV